MAIALLAGMRVGEIRELGVDNVRREGRIHYLDITAAKSEAGIRRGCHRLRCPGDRGS